ncbi:unnamed protein product [Closterium sp. Yama58-4]|nr:unnamed protein product [Closterium sp. Yama58-4]
MCIMWRSHPIGSFNVHHAFLTSPSHAAEPERQRLERGLPGCVLYADDRRLTASSLRAAGSDSFEAHGREFPYWLATKLINRAYAQRHGYRFVEMGEADKEPGRHPSWFKVRFLQRQLACCCEWAFFLDSDAYFRMDNHRLSVQSWVDRLTLPHYFDWITREYNISLANQTWFPRPPSSIFSHSPPACPPSPVRPGQGGGEGGAGEGEHEGWVTGGEGESRAAVCVVAPRNDDEASRMAEGQAGALFNSSMEYVNAGVTLWRRSPHCLKVRPETSQHMEREWEGALFNGSMEYVNAGVTLWRRSPHCLKVRFETSQHVERNAGGRGGRRGRCSTAAWSMSMRGSRSGGAPPTASRLIEMELN